MNKKLIFRSLILTIFNIALFQVVCYGQSATKIIVPPKKETVKKETPKPAQTPKPVSAAPKSTTALSVDVTSFSFGADGGQETLIVNSNNTWSTQDELSWCTVAKSGSTLTLLCPKNSNAESRSGSFYIIAGSRKEEIFVEQKGYVQLTVSEFEARQARELEQINSAVFSLNNNYTQEKTFYLGANKPTDITASFNNGVLKITGKGKIKDGEIKAENYSKEKTKEVNAEFKLLNSELQQVKILIIEEGITEIGEKNFKNLKNLTFVVINGTVINTGESAFENCSSLNVCVIKNGVKKIDEAAFSGCGKLTTIAIPESVKEIGEKTFENCKMLSLIFLPSELTKIQNKTFYNCSALKAIELPYRITKIGDKAFYACTNLVSIRIPDKVTEIGESAFQNCSGLSSVQLSENLTSIGVSAFESCTSLSSVYIPNNVTSIEKSAFQDCKNLVSVTLPSKITTLENKTFKNCINLKTADIPESVKTLGSSVFEDCQSLRKITLPKNVKEIGTMCFNGCTNLQSITVLNISPPSLGGIKGIVGIVEESKKKILPIYVPEQSVSSYRLAKDWSNFLKISSL